MHDQGEWKLGSHLRGRYESEPTPDLGSPLSMASSQLQATAEWEKGAFGISLKPQLSLSPWIAPSLFYGNPLYTPALVLREASGKLQAGTDTQRLTLSAGREDPNYGDGLVFGAEEWGNRGTAFDDARVRYSYGSGWVDLLVGAPVDFRVSASPFALQSSLALLYGSFGAMERDVDVYGYLNTTPIGQTVGAGMRVKRSLEPILYRIEAGAQVDSLASSTIASQVDAEFGFAFQAPARPRLSFEVFTSSKSYLPLYPTSHEWLGIADLFSRTNVSGYAAHLVAEPLEKLELKLSVFNFSRTDTSTGVVSGDGITPIGTGSGSPSAALATEGDLRASYRFGKQLEATIGGALLSPGAYLTSQIPNFQPLFFFTSLELQF